MAEEFTPTLNEVLSAATYRIAGTFHDPEWSAAVAAVDRALAAHDAEVARAAAEKAWDEGYRSGEGNASASIRAGARIVSDNPYRAEAPHA